MLLSPTVADSPPLARVRVWRLLCSEPLDAARNMAVDEALIRHARRTGEGVLRVYGWTRPALSVGRNQGVRRIYDAADLAARGIPIVRRITGGRALLHWREVTYAVAGPADDFSLRAMYGAINAVLVAALASIGVAATLAQGIGRLPAPGSAPCFERPAEGEVLHDGRKLAGSAQWREGGFFLQHGSILVEDDQSMVAALASVPVPAPSPAATLEEALGDALGDAAAAFERVSLALAAAMAAATAQTLVPLDPWEIAADVTALTAKYESDEWTWRR
jgi:lipoate-protein ligase A